MTYQNSQYKRLLLKSLLMGGQIKIERHRLARPESNPTQTHPSNAHASKQGHHYERVLSQQGTLDSGVYPGLW